MCVVPVGHIKEEAIDLPVDEVHYIENPDFSGDDQLDVINFGTVETRVERATNYIGPIKLKY